MKNEECSRRRAVAVLCRAAKAEMQNFFRSAYSTIVAPATKNVSSFFILHSTFLNRRQTNSGVALVMVLGLLTVMVLMAVTFAITMRTERLAAGNYADTVRARELVHVGIARALNNLVVDQQYGLGTNGLSSPGSKVYPDWPSPVVASSPGYSDPAHTNTSGNVYLLFATNGSARANEATNYVPRALWAVATNTDEIGASNQWVLIVSPGDSNIIGRVKYLIMNCSGLLDANFAGGAMRQGGTNPTEIAIANLGEIGSVADFHTGRSTDVRYETLAQLNASADFNKPATNLFVYSRALPGYWNTTPNCVGTQVNLSGSATSLLVSARMIAIMGAFTNAGFSVYESGMLYSNLVDYVDTNSVPQNLEYCVENVPMINEVVTSCQVNVQPDGLNKKYTVTYSINIEYWYPFITAADQKFILKSSIAFTEANNIRPNTPFAPPDDNINVPLPGDCIAIPHPAPVVTTPSMAGQFRMDLISTISASITTVGGDTVDQLINPIILTNILTWTSDGVTTQSFAAAECLDPRLNFDPNNKNLWVKNGSSHGTLNSKNSCTLTCLVPANDNDNDSDMYVGNRQLSSVAELGYLVYSTNAPWKTIKLYGPNRQRVLDVFGLSTNTSDIFMTNTVSRGLVNCNSNSTLDATAVVFAGMPVDKYPGGTPANLSMDDARTFVSRLFSGGICTNLSDVGRNLTPSDFLIPAAGITELEREAYFRNAFNLLNLRQNVFTIIIEAQAASGGNIPRNPARQRAVAIVWRDPYTGEMFVRHIKWLGD